MFRFKLQGRSHKAFRSTLLLISALWLSVFHETSVAAIQNIDLLVLYTKEARNRIGGAASMQTKINHLISRLNNVYSRSNIKVRAKAVHTEMLNFPGSDNVSDVALEKLTRHLKVISLRNQHQADFVVLLTLSKPVNGWRICGNAWVNRGGAEGLDSHDATGALSVVGINGCSADTLAHEIGHNMGLTHSEKQGDVGSSYPYARGYGVDFEYTTIMAYEYLFNAKRVSRFSNPNFEKLSSDGITKIRMGQNPGDSRQIPPESDQHGAHAVRALNKDAVDFASFSDCVWVLPNGWNYPVCQ